MLKKKVNYILLIELESKCALLLKYVTRTDDDLVSCNNCKKTLKFTTIQYENGKTSNIWKHSCLKLLRNSLKVKNNNNQIKIDSLFKTKWTQLDNDRITTLILKVLFIKFRH